MMKRYSIAFFLSAGLVVGVGSTAFTMDLTSEEASLSHGGDTHLLVANYSSGSGDNEEELGKACSENNEEVESTREDGASIENDKVGLDDEELSSGDGDNEKQMTDDKVKSSQKDAPDTKEISLPNILLATSKSEVFQQIALFVTEINAINAQSKVFSTGSEKYQLKLLAGYFKISQIIGMDVKARTIRNVTLNSSKKQAVKFIELIIKVLKNQESIEESEFVEDASDLESTEDEDAVKKSLSHGSTSKSSDLGEANEGDESGAEEFDNWHTAADSLRNLGSLKRSAALDQFKQVRATVRGVVAEFEKVINGRSRPEIDDKQMQEIVKQAGAFGVTTIFGGRIEVRRAVNPENIEIYIKKSQEFLDLLDAYIQTHPAIAESPKVKKFLGSLPYIRVGLAVAAVGVGAYYGLPGAHDYFNQLIALFPNTGLSDYAQTFLAPYLGTTSA